MVSQVRNTLNIGTTLVPSCICLESYFFQFLPLPFDLKDDPNFLNDIKNEYSGQNLTKDRYYTRT